MLDRRLKYKFYKMDKRFTGYPEFKHVIDVVGGNFYIEIIEGFNLLRDWCVDTWGQSIERDDYLLAMAIPKKHSLILNPAWCFYTGEHTHKIYLAGDAERTWAELRWK